MFYADDSSDEVRYTVTFYVCLTRLSSIAIVNLVLAYCRWPWSYTYQIYGISELIKVQNKTNNLYASFEAQLVVLILKLRNQWKTAIKK